MKRFIIMFVIVLAVAILWMVGWFFIAGQVRAEIDRLALADGVTEPRLVCDDLSVGGAPFSFSPHCRGATVVSGDVSVDLAAISGTALFYRPFHIQLFATGPARLTDAFTGASQEIRWSNLHASLRLADNSIERFSAVADDLVYADMLIGETVLGTATHAELHLIDATAPDPQPGTGRIYDAYAVFEDVASAPYAITNGRATIDAHLTGLPDPALWSDPQILAFWQALDGKLTLRGLEATADGFSLAAEGEANLTATGLIDANLEIASEGLSDRIATLLGDESIARIILGSPGDDGLSRQRLSIAGGTVTVGILPVAALPPLF